ncbi:MAG: heme-binding protein, partial [Alphaproteobacteria bacterium]|nr:heme-binding protein [Alphaproteobacteria bacterium]
ADQAGNTRTRMSNGFQIFPGSVPIYRNNTLIGGLGVSGDGIDQDDMASFLGLHNAGNELDTGVGNAPPEIRADTLAPQGVNLRYVNCPFKPFLRSRLRNACNNK